MEPNLMTFSQALQLMKEGRKVARMEWEEQGLWLTYLPEQNIFAGYINGHWHRGWQPITPDMLATDWREVESDVVYTVEVPADQVEEVAVDPTPELIDAPAPAEDPAAA